MSAVDIKSEEIGTLIVDRLGEPIAHSGGTFASTVAVQMASASKKMQRNC
jgi:hypothetical protein